MNGRDLVEEFRRQRRVRTGAIAALVILSLSALVAGCSHSTSPEPAPAVVFTPAETAVTAQFGASVRFAVSDGQGRPLTATFRRGDVLLATGAAYDYAAGQVGADSLRAEATTEAGTFGKTWQIWVDGGYDDRPPPVLDLIVLLGPQPGTLNVSWNRPSPSLGPRPFLRYWVKVAYDAPLTVTNWDAAVTLGEVPSLEGVLSYERDFTGLRQGAQAWVGVRLEDTGGVLSALLVTRQLRVAGGYRIRGTVVTLDASGHDVPLPGLSVSTGDCPECRALTGPNGSFALPDSAQAPAGFRDVDRHVLTVRDETTPGVGAFYDFRSDSLDAAVAYPYRVLMIPARDAGGAPLLTPSCGAAYVNLHTGQPEFLDFLEDLTSTSAIAQLPLRKWDRYPLAIWIRPAYSDSGGFALDPIARDAVDAWNERLGETYFTPAADSLSADVDLIFEPLGGLEHGLAEITDPPGSTYINTVVPRRMLVTVDRKLRYVAYARGVLLHELGHALCLGRHSACPDDIMSAGGRPVDVGQPLAQAMTEQEAMAVRYVRHLRQNINMRQYLWE